MPCGKKCHTALPFVILLKMGFVGHKKYIYFVTRYELQYDFGQRKMRIPVEILSQAQTQILKILLSHEYFDLRVDFRRIM